MTTITVKRYGIYERRSGSIAACSEIDLRRTPHLAVMYPGYNVSAETGKMTTDDTESQNDLVREIVVSEFYRPWNGGDNPSPEWKVEVVYRDGSRSRGHSADFSWGRCNAGDDIVAFRPIRSGAATTSDSSPVATAEEASLGISPSPFGISLQTDMERGLTGATPRVSAKLRSGMPERFYIDRAANGGFIVTENSGDYGRINSVLAALSSEEDLLGWLAGKGEENRQ